MCAGVLENALIEIVRHAVRTEVQELSKLSRDEDRLVTIDQVAQRLSEGLGLPERQEITFTRKLGPKMVRFCKLVSRNG
jgi:hypothetical protein